MCILSIYTSLNVVGCYDSSVLSMSVMGFPKKVWMGGGWVGGVSAIQFFLGIFGIFYFAKPLRAALGRDVVVIRSTCPIYFHLHIFTSWVIGFVVLMCS